MSRHTHRGMKKLTKKERVRKEQRNERRGRDSAKIARVKNKVMPDG